MKDTVFNTDNLLKLQDAGYYVETLQGDYKMIGIREPQKHIFYWFDVYNSCLIFHHAYCQNTGKAKRGVKLGWKIEMRLRKAIEKLTPCPAE